MGISNFINRTCTQTAVYWGNPKDDGGGGKTFDDPVEINCRWEEKKQLIDRVGERTGEQIVSKAAVTVLQDVDELGYLFLGTLYDLSSSEEGNPRLLDNAYEIKRFDRIPALGSTTEFIRIAYL
jgi:hypothetical protein